MTARFTALILLWSTVAWANGLGQIKLNFDHDGFVVGGTSTFKKGVVAISGTYSYVTAKGQEKRTHFTKRFSGRLFVNILPKGREFSFRENRQPGTSHIIRRTAVEIEAVVFYDGTYTGGRLGRELLHSLRTVADSSKRLLDDYRFYSDEAGQDAFELLMKRLTPLQRSMKTELPYLASAAQRFHQALQEILLTQQGELRPDYRSQLDSLDSRLSFFLRTSRVGPLP